MKTVCKKNECTGCNACVAACKKKAIHINDTMIAFNAIIDENICVNCGACMKTCPVNYPVNRFIPRWWFQGWSGDEQVRMNSASGGFATAISKFFIRDGGVVATCFFERGEFVYKLINDVNDLERAAGSKYVKSSTGDIYEKIKVLLMNNQKVLFLGLPCQVAGLLSSIGESLRKNLYTIDLICHGTPSVKLLNIRLKQSHINISEIDDIKFRIKNSFHIYNGYNPIEDLRCLDPYIFTFLKGINYTNNCYNCQYAREERISDITLGDSWGSKLPFEEMQKGISLALCQSEKGKELLENADLLLLDADKNVALKSNYQLNHPMKKSIKHLLFFKCLHVFKNYKVACFFAAPIIMFKQFVKKVLIHMNVWGGIKQNKYTIIIK